MAEWSCSGLQLR